MIPKTIHYCWFGGKPLPRSARKCIASWRRFFPDYGIVEWNEGNYDVGCTRYTREAYDFGKYAFVSDYARFDILHRHGGLYFDTDVEVIRDMSDIVGYGAFMGMEKEEGVNPGLGIGAPAGLELYGEVLEHYAGLSYAGPDGSPLPGTVVTHVTDVLRRHGFTPRAEPQDVLGVRVYPNDYFNPLDDATGRLEVTGNTRCIHWYAKTWVDNYGPVRKWAARLAHRVLGAGRPKGEKMT